MSPLYVETRISSRMDLLWEHTPDAAIHQRWELRFTEIRPVDTADGSTARAPPRGF